MNNIAHGGSGGLRRWAASVGAPVGRTVLALVGLSGIGLALLLPTAGWAGEAVTVRIERAQSVAGPWERIDLREALVDAEGNPRVLMENSEEYFRARVELGAGVEAGDPIPLAEVPEFFRERAQFYLETRRSVDDEGVLSDPEGWTEHAVLGPWVRQPGTIMGDGSVRPAYYEFKVINELPPEEETVFGGTSPDRLAFERDAGYLLLSMTEEDFPLPEYATKGPTPTERLARLAGTSRIQVLRFGAGFWAAEDEQGRLVASDGSLPYRFPKEFYGLDVEWRGDDELELDEEPPDLPRLRPEFYASYEEFKVDYAEGDAGRLMREGIARRARVEWEMLRGEGPPMVTLAIGEEMLLLPDLAAEPAPYVYFQTDDEAPLRIVTPRTGGVLLVGAGEGFGLLEVRQGEEDHLFRVNVLARGAGGGRPGPQGHITGHIMHTWMAGTDAMQPAYHQPLRNEWCKSVGCGPLAWAMLFSWFDRNWNVGMAFQGPTYNQNVPAPPNLSTTAHLGAALFTLRELHDLCDVICNPTNNEGATLPTNMTGAFKGYTWLPRMINFITRSWTTRATWPPTKLSKGAAPSRDAIWNGYPSVVGYSWHYGLAYGYVYEAQKAGDIKLWEKRWLKCNNGQGGGGINGTKWINYGNVFYSARVRIGRGTAHP